jgi:histidinol phosphatase-like PHP family hydrolase
VEVPASAITDHSQAVRIAKGLGKAQFRAQARRIEALRAEVDDITILHSAEVDILPDGRLDLELRSMLRKSRRLVTPAVTSQSRTGRA